MPRPATLRRRGYGRRTLGAICLLAGLVTLVTLQPPREWKAEPPVPWPTRVVPDFVAAVVVPDDVSARVSVPGVAQPMIAADERAGIVPGEVAPHVSTAGVTQPIVAVDERAGVIATFLSSRSGGPFLVPPSESDTVADVTSGAIATDPTVDDVAARSTGNTPLIPSAAPWSKVTGVRAGDASPETTSAAQWVQAAGVEGHLFSPQAPSWAKAARTVTDDFVDRVAGLAYVREALSVQFGGSSPIPLGYYNLCRSNASACRLVTATKLERTPEGAVRLTPRLVAQLSATNDKVNSSMRQVPDKMIDGIADRWTIGGSSGDCEDFALTKRQRLIAKGWPSSALLVALATTKDGRLHAVLVVRTDQGDLVLDSLRREIRGWQPSLYGWLEIQSPTDQWAWFAFGRS